MPTPPPRTPGTAPVSTADGAYGLLRLAGLDVALPLTALREVVPCPDQLAALPVSAAGLLGAMDLRSLVLPVVDLRPVLDRAGDSPPDQVVVVTAHDGQAVGLLADQVLGVIRVPQSALQPVRVAHGDGRRALFSHTFRSPADGTIVSVLDAEAILALPGVPTVKDASKASPAGERAAAAGGLVPRASRTYATVECGPYRLAIDADSVHTLLPSSATIPSVLDSALCRGVAEFSGREVPVVDPLVLLGFAPLPEGDTGAGLVLDLEHGYVILALSGLLSLDELADDDLLPVADFVVSRPELLAGMVDSPGLGTCLVLDQQALRNAPELLGLSAVNTTLGAADGARGTGTGTGTVQRGADAGPPYLTYSAGQPATSPLEQIAEILPLPAASDLVPVGDHVLGVVLHRRAVVPLLCLATLLGRVPGPVTPASCWLLVHVDGQPFGFAVDALHEIDPLSWADADHEAGRDTDLSAVLRRSRLVQVGACQDLLPEVDLHGLARAVRGGSRVLEPAGWSG